MAKRGLCCPSGCESRGRGLQIPGMLGMVGGNEEMVRGNAGLGGGNLKHTFSHCRGKNT